MLPLTVPEDASSVSERAPRSESDPARSSGIYPIFEDGHLALDWVRRHKMIQACSGRIDQHPADADLYLERATAELDFGAIWDAILDCTRALSLCPRSVPALLTRA